MKIVAVVFLAVWLLPARTAEAQQPSLEITQSLLNRIISGVGRMSATGVSQPYNVHQVSPSFELCVPLGRFSCPGLGTPPAGFGSNEIPLVACRTYGGRYAVLPVGDPVSWQWWVSNAYVTLAANSMKFTATVIMRVGGEWSQETRTVNAALQFEPTSGRMRLNVANFTVPLKIRNSTADLREGPVDVSRMFGLSLEIAPQAFAVPLPNGTTRNVNARVTGATASYSPGLAKVSLSVAY